MAPARGPLELPVRTQEGRPDRRREAACRTQRALTPTLTDIEERRDMAILTDLPYARMRRNPRLASPYFSVWAPNLRSGCQRHPTQQWGLRLSTGWSTHPTPLPAPVDEGARGSGHEA
eukprot:353206-Chlamydomonas_euryale.AAC.10